MLRLSLLVFTCLTLGAAAPAWAESEKPVLPAAAPELKAAPDGVTPEATKVDGARLPEPEIPRSEPPDLAAGELDLGMTLFRTLVVLAMVVALAYLTLNVGLRRLLGIRAPSGASVVTVLERVALDQKRALFVVEAAGEVLLLGGADSSLQLIAKLDRAEVEKTRAPAQEGATGAVQLSPFLQKLLGKKDPKPPPAA